MTLSDALAGFVVLDESECLELLAHAAIGRVGFVLHGRPEILPVNYGADRTGCVLFRTGERSSLTTIDGHAVVFEVDGFDAGQHTGWSVCLHGTAQELSPREELSTSMRGVTVISWAPGQRDRWFAVTPTSITGRRLPMSAAPADVGWLPGVVG
jgi:nitroimidazol reductase NimA-like FMN-containing flavoprotein (pyridoxamine 5'-phosphate oxidase superfamily)